jgi:hypothetical protein
LCGRIANPSKFWGRQQCSLQICGPTSATCDNPLHPSAFTLNLDPADDIITQLQVTFMRTPSFRTGALRLALCSLHIAISLGRMALAQTLNEVTFHDGPTTNKYSVVLTQSQSALLKAPPAIDTNQNSSSRVYVAVSSQVFTLLALLIFQSCTNKSLCIFCLQSITSCTGERAGHLRRHGNNPRMGEFR